MRILLIEDEPILNQQIKNALEQLNYVVDSSLDGAEGLYLGQEYPIDLAIIDINLPSLNGLEIIRRLRQAERHFPILILTAHNRWQDKVTGLEAGADDYLAKPFHIEELVARIKALLRRSAGWSQALLQAGPISINTNTQEVFLEEKLIKLTAYEYRLLEYLILHKGQVLSKMLLTDHIYAEETDRDSNVLEVFIRRLRQKLDPSGELQPIETLRGRGYRFKDF